MGMTTLWRILQHCRVLQIMGITHRLHMCMPVGRIMDVKDHVVIG